MGNIATCDGDCKSHILEEEFDGVELWTKESPNTKLPLGVVFDETVRDVTAESDRLLLLLSSATNACAIRWLLFLGADSNASDCNGTTALHAAARSGSKIMADALLSSGAHPNSEDSAGFTPLHVALYMNRLAVAEILIRQGADVWKRNYADQVPVDLCTDPVLKDLISSFMNSSSPPWEFEWEPVLPAAQGKRADPGSSHSDQGVTFYPSFVAMPCNIGPVAPHTRKAIKRLALAYFNSGNGGRALSLLTTTGCIRNSPVAMASFICKHKIDPVELGKFFGGKSSVCEIIFTETLTMLSVGEMPLIPTLIKIFSRIAVPPSLLAIDRLSRIIARIWVDRRQPGPARVCDNVPFEEPSPCVNCVAVLASSTLVLASRMNKAAASPSLAKWLVINKSLTCVEKGDRLPRRRLRPLEEVYVAISRDYRTLLLPETVLQAESRKHEGREAVTSKLVPRCVQMSSAGRLCNITFIRNVTTAGVDVIPQTPARKSENSKGPKDGSALIEKIVGLDIIGELLFFSLGGPRELNRPPDAFLHRLETEIVEVKTGDAEFVLGSTSKGQPLKLVTLLEDARWQAVDLGELRIGVADQALLSQWVKVWSL